MPNENVDLSMLLSVLKQIPLFKDLDENMHREIIPHIVLMTYPAGHIIFSEGDAGDAMYILKKGQVQIYHPKRGEGDEERDIAEIYDGGFFGEMALISDLPRNASARTMIDSEIFILSKEDFKTLLNNNKTLAEQVSAAVVARLKDNNQSR